jgi:hypothetical protein
MSVALAKFYHTIQGLHVSVKKRNLVMIDDEFRSIAESELCE